jgi:hypothetical protein
MTVPGRAERAPHVTGLLDTSFRITSVYDSRQLEPDRKRALIAAAFAPSGAHPRATHPPTREDRMSSIIVRHRVADFDAWKTAFDEHGTVRREYGLADNGVLRDEEDANMVTILLGTDDTARAREFLASDSLRETMSGAGVVSQPDVYIANEA